MITNAILIIIVTFALLALSLYDFERYYRRVIPPEWAMAHDKSVPECNCVGWARPVTPEVIAFMRQERNTLPHDKNCDGWGFSRKYTPPVLKKY